MAVNGEEVTILEKMLMLIEKYGIKKIFKAFFVIGILLYVIYNIQNLNKIITKVITTSIDNAVQSELVSYDTKQKEAHDEAMTYRKYANEKIPQILDDIMIRTECSRVFIIEAHNGSQSVSGLPFTYGNMTYEKDKDVIPIADDYSDIVLSRFPFLIYIEKNKAWSGTTDELMQIDRNLAFRLKSNNANYLFLVRLEGKNNMIGYLGVTFCDTMPKNVDKIKQELLIDAQSIVLLLDIDNNI